MSPHTSQNKGHKQQMLVRMWRNGTLIHCWWEYKLVQSLWKTVWRFLKKVKIELPYDPAIPLLGIYPKETKALIWKDTCTPMFTAALFTIVKVQKQPKCPSTDEWIEKMWYIYIYAYICMWDIYISHTYIHTHKGIILSHKKEWNFAIWSNMDGTGGHYAKWNNHVEKDKYCMVSLIRAI